MATGDNGSYIPRNLESRAGGAKVSRSYGIDSLVAVLFAGVLAVGVGIYMAGEMVRWGYHWIRDDAHEPLEHRDEGDIAVGLRNAYQHGDRLGVRFGIDAYPPGEGEAAVEEVERFLGNKSKDDPNNS